MKNAYSTPAIEIIFFPCDGSKITTSFTFNELDDGGLYSDKWF